MRFEIDPTIMQGRFDIGSDNSFTIVKSATVLKRTYSTENLGDFSTGQPVIGELLTRVSMQIAGDFIHNIQADHGSLSELEEVLRQDLPVLSEDSIRSCVQSMAGLLTSI